LNGNSVNLSKRQRNIGSVVGNGDNSGNNALNGVASGNGVNNLNGNLVGAGSNVRSLVSPSRSPCGIGAVAD